MGASASTRGAPERQGGSFEAAREPGGKEREAAREVLASRDKSTLSIGQRVLVAGYAGHIRFMGTADFGIGNWVGVELDEAAGVNAGWVHGKQYFDCGPMHGIFVRAEAIKPQPVESTKDLPTPCRLGIADECIPRRTSAALMEMLNTTDTASSPKVHKKSDEERQLLRGVVRTSSDTKLKVLFGALSDTDVESVVDAVFTQRVEAGTTVIDEGADDRDYFYVVKSGKFEVTKSVKREGKTWDKVKVHEVSSGYSFGEVAELFGTTRSSNVVAMVDSEVWCLERQCFLQVLVGSHVARFQANAEILGRCGLFGELDPSDLNSLAEFVGEEEFAADEVILSHGEKDGNLYVLKSGGASAVTKTDDFELQVRTYASGDYFSPLSLVDSHTCICATEVSTCVYIAWEAVTQVLGEEMLKRHAEASEKANQEALEAAREAGESQRTASASAGSELLEADTSVCHTLTMRGSSSSLADKVQEDFSVAALVCPNESSFELPARRFQLFGGLRLGERYSDNKVAVCRSETSPQANGLVDRYSWKATSGLAASTEIAVICQKGQKSSSDPTPNQDNYFVLHVRGCGIYGVCDGHGPFGHLVSFQLVQNLPRIIASSPHFGEDWERCLREAFASAQEELLEFCKAYAVNINASGAAMSVLIFDGSQLHIAHIGDAGVMVGSWNRHDSRLVHATKDHKPDSPEERERLEASGSEVRTERDQGPRIYLPGTTFPGLTMSRAFGDTALAGMGVSHEPEYMCVDMQSTDEWYAILASDGLWEFLTPDQVLTVTSKKVRLKGPTTMVQYAAETSQKLWKNYCGDYCDDVTVVCVQWNAKQLSDEFNHHCCVTRHE